jgi:hypothetical protein
MWKGIKYTIKKGMVPPPKVVGHVKLVLEVVLTKSATPFQFNLH